ncbi:MULTISPECIES: GrpB family protein [unclassified Sphingobacterium]|uniref:GrpB family protein n=1 Tax=unclassified Sphingobacterium TaxID=2609468 RepID=UPI0025D57958|nr:MULTISPECIES: GrpB family protein [unclassified Sphingobacterium]
MKVTFEKYNALWDTAFKALEAELKVYLNEFDVQIEHIGSTSVKGLSAKPIIDILIGLKNPENLDNIPALLMAKDYIYYENYNTDMPYRRFFVKLNQSPGKLGLPVHITTLANVSEELHNHKWRLAHIHILPLASEHWNRHIAFREYLRNHAVVREEYQVLKEKLSTQEWIDGNDYNAAKDSFIKQEEQKAVQWYNAPQGQKR